MDIETVVYRLLLTDSGISALASGRAFHGELPQEPPTAWPCLIYRPRGDKTIIQTLEGGCALISQGFQIWSVGRKSSHGGKRAAGQLDDAVFNRLAEFSGAVLDASAQESIQVQGVFPEICHLYDGDLAGADTDPEACAFLSEFVFHYLDPVRSDP